MSIFNEEVFIISHRHTPLGQTSTALRNTPLVNPLHRTNLQRIASYIPIFSTFIGIKTLKGISSLQYSMVLMTGNFSSVCKTLPCPEIYEELPKVRKEAWLEIFGIKALYYLVLGVIKIIKLIVRYLCPCCRPPEPREPQNPLTPTPLDMGQQIDAIFSTPTSPTGFKDPFLDDLLQEDKKKAPHL